MDEEQTTTEGATRVWLQYLRSGSTLWQLLYLLLLYVVSQIAISVADFYLIFWTAREDQRIVGDLNDQTRVADLVVYTGVLGLVIMVSWQLQL